ncbi:MAG: hypothetical protein WEB60_14305, partial [Terrimicrobiaceae bacterium]
MDVSFFMPEQYLPETARREAWKSGAPLQLEQGGKAACVQCWIYQTWVHLSNAGFPAKLVHHMPEKGVVVALSGNLHPTFRPGKGLYVVGVVADGLPHPHVHWHILQNSAWAKQLGSSTYIPLWTQPNLVPRDPSRGNTLETLRFYGDGTNLAKELRDPAFVSHCWEALRLKVEARNANLWHDYSDTDCAFAIRAFDRAPCHHKPPTKLANAWLAGVPFIGGADSAYASEGRAGIDHMTCQTPQDFLNVLQKLKSDPALREGLVAQGKVAAKRHTIPALTSRWADFLSGEAIPTAT